MFLPIYLENAPRIFKIDIKFDEKIVEPFLIENTILQNVAKGAKKISPNHIFGAL